MESLERFAQNQRIIEEFASHWLADISSDLGRLVHISLQRNVSTGRYSHPALDEVYSESAVHQALLYCHEELFQRVLETQLEHLEWDLRVFFAGLDTAPHEAAARWLDVEFFRQLVPLGTALIFRDLFVANMRTILSLVAARAPSLQTAA